MEDNTLTAISVIGALFIAVLSGPVAEGMKWVRERETAKRERVTGESEAMRQAAHALLGQLRHFLHSNLKDVETSGYRDGVQIWSDLRIECYVWELAIRKRLDPARQNQVSEIRKKLERIHEPNCLQRLVPELTDETLSLTLSAIDRIK